MYRGMTADEVEREERGRGGGGGGKQNRKRSTHFQLTYSNSPLQVHKLS